MGVTLVFWVVPQPPQFLKAWGGGEWPHNNMNQLLTPLGGYCQAPLICKGQLPVEFIHQLFIHWWRVCVPMIWTLVPKAWGSIVLVKRGEESLEPFKCCWWLIHLSCLTMARISLLFLLVDYIPFLVVFDISGPFQLKLLLFWLHLCTPW